MVFAYGHRMDEQWAAYRIWTPRRSSIIFIIIIIFVVRPLNILHSYFCFPFCVLTSCALFVCVFFFLFCNGRSGSGTEIRIESIRVTVEYTKASRWRHRRVRFCVNYRHMLRREISRQINWNPLHCAYARMRRTMSFMITSFQCEIRTVNDYDANPHKLVPIKLRFLRPSPSLFLHLYLYLDLSICNKKGDWTDKINQFDGQQSCAYARTFECDVISVPAMTSSSSSRFCWVFHRHFYYHA